MTDDSVNFALASSGATVVDVSHEALHVASAASNLLLEREDLLWITGDAPQYVTIRIQPQHPPIVYVGWHVWHDYLSNPKTVEVSSGVRADCLTSVVTCNALPGAGTQLWELPQPIPPAHQFVRFTIHATFAPGPTYMNHLSLYAQHPGSRLSGKNTADTLPTSALRAAPDSATADTSGRPQPLPGSTATGGLVASGATGDAHAATSIPVGQSASAPSMSTILRDLDEDIKALHPIRTVSPTRNTILFREPNAVSLPSLVDAEIGEYLAAAHRHSPSSSQARQSLSVPPPPPPPQLPVGDTPANGARQQMQVATTQSHPSGLAHSSRDASLSVVDNTAFRLAALEQAVTSLTRAMEHQRQDIVAIKELLVHRRAPPPPPPQAAAPSTEIPEVKFPEETLKRFIDEALAPRLSKQAKKTEVRIAEKLEEHVTSMIDEVKHQIDHRVRGYLNHLTRDHPSSSAAPPVMHSPEGASYRHGGVHQEYSHADAAHHHSARHTQSSAAKARTFGFERGLGYSAPVLDDSYGQPRRTARR